MTMLSKYYVPGLAIEDHSIDVPLDWTGHEPGRAFDGETIKLFYRVVTTPEHVHDDLPLPARGNLDLAEPAAPAALWRLFLKALRHRMTLPQIGQRGFEAALQHAARGGHRQNIRQR